MSEMETQDKARDMFAAIFSPEELMALNDRESNERFTYVLPPSPSPSPLATPRHEAAEGSSNGCCVAEMENGEPDDDVDDAAAVVMTSSTPVVVPCLEELDRLREKCERDGIRVLTAAAAAVVAPKSTQGGDGPPKTRPTTTLATASLRPRQKLQEAIKNDAVSKGMGVKLFRKKILQRPMMKKRKKGDDYEVEHILDLQIREDKPFYLVKWKGWPSETNTWEPKEHLYNCTKALCQFYGTLNVATLKSTVLSQIKDLPEPERSEEYKRLKCLYKKEIRLNISELQVMRCLSVAAPSTDGGDSHDADAVAMQEMQKKKKAKKEEEEEARAEMRFRLRAWEAQINAMIRKGEPRIVVVNDVDLEGPPENFTFINDYKPFEGIVIQDDPLVGCECDPVVGCHAVKDRCCAKQAGGEYAYTTYKKLRIPFGKPIYECNRRCKCGSDCVNRVVQHGRKVRLCIFRTSNGCGWGVKSLQKIKRGTFVTEYVGEVITNEEAEKRGTIYDAEGRTYLFDLDYNDGDCIYTVDAATYGNVSHFINHSCDPNLAVYGVWINTLDPMLPTIAFFTTRDVEKGEELTFDYKMTGDTTKPVKDANRIPCKCGAEKCRKFLY